MRRFDFNGITFSQYQKFVFSTIDGLNEGEVTRQTGQYLGQDGIDILSANYEARKITLNGRILASDETELYAFRQQLVKACDGKTKDILKYHNGNAGYFSEAVADIPQFGVRFKTSVPFSIDFTLYNFFWKSQYNHIDNIYKRVDNLTGTFQFPLILTTRTNIATLTNIGDIECPLIIMIEGNGSATGDDGFKVINNTTGEFITVLHDIDDGEVVTIDTQELTITSSVDGNILHYITDDSTLDLKLDVGANELEGINYASNEINITTEHYDVYMGV